MGCGRGSDCKSPVFRRVTKWMLLGSGFQEHGGPEPRVGVQVASTPFLVVLFGDGEKEDVGLVPKGHPFFDHRQGVGGTVELGIVLEPDG